MSPNASAKAFAAASSMSVAEGSVAAAAFTTIDSALSSARAAG